MNLILQKLADKAVWITLLVVFVLGVLADHYVLSPAPKFGTDTTMTIHAVTPPAPIISGPIAGTPAKPDVVSKWRDKLVPDTAAIIEATSQLSAQIDSLMLDKQVLQVRLETLLAPHVAVYPFDVKTDNAELQGRVGMQYIPMQEMFNAQIVYDKILLPQLKVTRTLKSPWWVKPAAFAGGVFTTYYIGKKDLLGSVVAGGLSATVILVEW